MRSYAMSSPDMSPASRVIVHIGIDVSADDGEIWASINRCNAFGRVVSSEDKSVSGKYMTAIDTLIHRELIAYPKLTSLEVNANIEGIQNADQDRE